MNIIDYLHKKRVLFLFPHPDDEVYHVTIKSEEEAPVIIGRHGETIKAIQKILEVILYKKLGESVEILVNVKLKKKK